MFKKVSILLIFLAFFFSPEVFALDVLEDSLSLDVNMAPIEEEQTEVEQIMFAADTANDIIKFVQLSNQIGNASSTIIPNKLVAENKEGDLRQLSSYIVLNIEKLTSDTTKSITLVIGDAKVVTEEEYEALCRIVQSEAGSQDMVGKVLIANVIFNRMASSKFPNDVCSVILSPGQFSPVSNGSYYSCKVSDETRKAVEQALNGVDYSEGALYFMARSAAQRNAVSWFDTALTYLFKHGGHEFFK